MRPELLFTGYNAGMHTQNTQHTSHAPMRWLLFGFALAGLTTWMSVAATWPRLAPSMQLRVGWPAYTLAVALSHLTWVALAWGVVQLSRRWPLWPASGARAWAVHLGAGLLIAAGHLALDTALLWLAFALSFDFFTAWWEKCLRWMPYELMLYWLVIALATVFALRRRLQAAHGTGPMHVLIRDVRGSRRVAVDEIDWIEACDNYVVLHCGAGQHMKKDTMQRLEKDLARHGFFRTHRACLVNLARIECLRRSDGRARLHLLDGTELPLSRRRSAALNRALQVREVSQA